MLLGVAIGVISESWGGVILMVTLSSITVGQSFGLPAISVTFSGSISNLRKPLFVVCTVISNLVPLLGLISVIVSHVLVATVPTNQISLQVKSHVVIGSENVTRNFITLHEVGSFCPSAKSIEICGLTASNVHDIGEYLVDTDQDR